MLPGVLDAQLPAVVLTSVQRINGVLGVIPENKKYVEMEEFTNLK